MQTMRAVWLTKLSIIHQIKFDYGKGVGNPVPSRLEGEKRGSPVRSSQNSAVESPEVNFDDDAGFGQGFDPTEWA